MLPEVIRYIYVWQCCAVPRGVFIWGFKFWSEGKRQETYVPPLSVRGFHVIDGGEDSIHAIGRCNNPITEGQTACYGRCNYNENSTSNLFNVWLLSDEISDLLASTN